MSVDDWGYHFFSSTSDFVRWYDRKSGGTLNYSVVDYWWVRDFEKWVKSCEKLSENFRDSCIKCPVDREAFCKPFLVGFIEELEEEGVVKPEMVFTIPHISKKRAVLLFIIVSILAGWLGVYSLIWSVRWIVAGFKGEK